MKSNSEEIKLKINFYLDYEFLFQQELSTYTTILDLKKLILRRLGMYSVNYLIEYNDRDYSKFEIFRLGEIVLNACSNKEYNINIKNIDTYIKENQNQRVMITYDEGGALEFICYDTRKLKLEKIPPEKSSCIKWTSFPYNSRYCHIVGQNKIVISGGVNAENSCCIYDYDINYLMELPDMKVPRQNHSMINFEDKVFIIGGVGCKSVECLSLEFEDWTKYPDMFYDRKDPSICIVNNQYLYVLMGYSQSLGQLTQSFEILDISQDPWSEMWKLFSINNPHGIKIKSHSGIVSYGDGFLLLGGFNNSQSESDVNYFDINEKKLQFSKCYLPFTCAFGEKSMVKKEENEYFLFTYATNKLVRFDMKNLCFYEVGI